MGITGIMMEGAAVSSSRVAQWPSHRASSVGTLQFRLFMGLAMVIPGVVAVSMSLLEQSR